MGVFVCFDVEVWRGAGPGVHNTRGEEGFGGRGGAGELQRCQRGRAALPRNTRNTTSIRATSATCMCLGVRGAAKGAFLHSVLRCVASRSY
eukprot:3025374-Rhodomonas_salina.3